MTDSRAPRCHRSLRLADINSDALEVVVNEIARAGGSAAAYIADVSDESSIEEPVAAVVAEHRVVNT